jgi:hypothetical protein
MGPATKYPVNLDFFANETPELFYFLGIVAADGSVCRKACVREQHYITKAGEVHTYLNKWSEAKIEIALQERDLGLLEVIRDAVCPGKPIYHRPQTKAYRLSINDRDAVELVEGYGILPRKTYNLTIAECLYQSILFRHFLRGYFDGDGSIGIKHGRKQLTGILKHYYGAKARIFGRSKVLECFSAHIAAVLPVKRGKVYYRPKCNVSFIEYGFKAANSFLDYIYQDATWKLDRKNQQYMNVVCSDSGTLRQHYKHRPLQSIPLKDS